MRVGVLGASGFIGRHLCAALRARGDDVLEASLRDPHAAANTVGACEAVINLAGEPVAQRWSERAKRKIEESRTVAPRKFFAALRNVPNKMRHYISASAIGYYGTSTTQHFTENSPPGTDFLAQVCVKWEATAQEASSLGAVVTCIRNGLVLGTDGGALPRVLTPFRLGMGGRVDSGKQWYSWIHIDDAVGIFLHALGGIAGALNATSPNPVRNSDFTKDLGKAVHRPTLFPVPRAAISAVLGEGAYVVTEGQYVVPQRTVATGYVFKYATLEDALRSLV